MPLSRWLSGGRPGLRDRVVKALQQARDGDADGAIDTIAERFSEALGELQSLRQPVDAGRLGVWLDKKDAVAAFARAAELRPDVFGVPYRVKRERFTRMAEVALAAI